ncbi:50S ribosomal protein L13 [Erysipelotrichaceae bacterium OttesenSCG-928-M19]|nr:50S ribosomal protein L13 [Erysipelotrichaceae bacterium OttesenSCG-928-M19]
MRQTTMANESSVERKWFVVDATGLTLGRLSTQVATILRGKHKPTYTPHVDCGDYVIILNADKIKLTGNKLQGKKYYNHSGYIGGMRVRNAQTMIDNYPVEMLERSIHGMLPKNTLGRQQGKKLFVYTTNEHPHMAQKPEVLVIKD